jgi:hypothetical protein
VSIEAKVDTSDLLAAMDKLAGSDRVHLARSLGAGAGEVLRDEAKLLAPAETGRLASSIYLAFREGKSNEARVVYSISWNGRKAPHGHLQEFGHWQPYRVMRRPDGTYFTDKTQPLAQPKWVPAHPFLRPAMAAFPRALSAGVARARKRLPELLAGATDES